MKKLLIVSGCSWSNIKFKSDQHPELDTSWPKWHELLADMLGMELISLGKNGAGQEYIYNSLVECIIGLDDEDKDRIGLVIPAWSRSPRRDYQADGLWRNHRFDACGDIKYMLSRSLRYYYQFQIFCERFNLPYKQIHMLDALNFPINEIPEFYAYHHRLPSQTTGHQKLLDKVAEKNIKKSPVTGEINRYCAVGNETRKMSRHCPETQKMIDYTASTFSLYHKINEENFIGWPLIRAFGGYALDQHVICVSKEKYRVSDQDFHPNKLGNEKLASFIYENL